MNRTCKNSETRRRCYTRLMSKAMLIALFMAALVGWNRESLAITKTFNVNSGSWAMAGNWNPSGVPAAGDDVVFPSTVTSVTNVPNGSINSVTIEGTSGTINLQGATSGNTLTIVSEFSLLQGRTLTIGNTSRLNLVFATTCTSTIAGTLTIYSGSTSRGVTNNGDLTMTSSGLINQSGTSYFTLAAGATLRIGSPAGITTAGTASGNIQTGTRTYSAGANYIYNGTANQVTGNGLTQNQPANVTINNPGNTVSLSGNRSISGNLSILAGTFDLSTFTMNRSASGGTLSISDGATLRIGGTNPAPTNFGRSFAANSTVEYYGAAQSIGTETFGNLLISAGTKSTTGNVAVNGNLTINSGAGLSSAHSWEIAGNWTNNGTFSQSSGIVTFNGTSQVIAGSTTTAFQNLTIAAGSIVTGTTAPNPGTFNINNGGKYIHTAATAVVPGSTKNFAASSTYEWQGTNNFPSVGGITFGNLIINSTSGNNNASGNLTSIMGDLVIMNTGTGSYRLAGGTSPGITISGNLIVENGQLNFSSTSGAPVVTVKGDVVLNGGVLRPQLGTGIPVFEVKGNWLNNNAGSFVAGSGTVTFNGTATQSIGGSAATTFFNLAIATGSVANLGTLAHTANTLTLGGIGRANGSWGHPNSTATYKNNVYFAANTGTVNVSTGTCTAPAMMVQTSNVSCFGGNDGSITVTVTGGVADYEFSINGGSTWTSPQASNQYTFNNLTVAGGPYTIAVRDASGCVQTNCE